MAKAEEVLSETRPRDLVAYLSAGDPSRPYPPSITPKGQGGKFEPDGTILVHPGNTFLCHIDKGSDFFAALCAMQDDLKQMRFADHFAFLPKSSFHMTLFCGISGSPLGADGWPEDVPEETDLETITARYLSGLNRMTGEDGYEVVATGMSLPATVAMTSATAIDEQKLRGMRDRLQALTGLYRPDFESYGFHVSMAYQSKWLDAASAEAVIAESRRLFDAHLAKLPPHKLGPVEFCTFETMNHFSPIGILDSTGFHPR